MGRVFLTDAGFEELAADPLVHPDGLGDLLHVGPGGLTEGADAVDAADPLCQKCIGCLHEHTHTHRLIYLIILLDFNSSRESQSAAIPIHQLF